MGDTSIQWTDKTWNPTRGCAAAGVACFVKQLGARQPSLRVRQFPVGS